MTHKVPMHAAEITDAGMIHVAAGSTGQQGGDSGHGGRTVVRIQGNGADIVFRLFGPVDDDNAGAMEIIASGDAELRMLARAMDYIASSLLGVLATPPEHRPEPDSWHLTDW